MLYGERLKFLRERLNLKQKDLLDIVSLCDAQYSSYEREHEIMPVKHLNTLCNYFNVSLDYVFSFTNIKQYENNNIKEIDKKLAGKRLKEFRKNNKITQAKLAKILNTTQSTITGYEVGKNIIATPFLYTICKKYNISADYLLGKIDNPKFF